MYENYNDKDKGPGKGSKFNKKAYKHALSSIESSGGKFLQAGIDPETGEPYSSAAGNYHFLYESIKFDPEMDGISKREFMNRPELQERIMDKALNGTLKGYSAYGEKYSNKLKKEFNSDKSVNEIAAMVHFLGPGGTRSYLKNPEEYKVSGKKNATVDNYIKKFNSNFDQYLLDNPEEPEKAEPQQVQSFGPSPKHLKEETLMQPKDNIAFSQRSLSDMIPQQQYVGTQENQFKQGGQMQTPQGGVEELVTRFENGGLHEENPLGGIPLGEGANGKPNLVEEGETKWNDYIFSNVYDMDGNYTGGGGPKKNVFKEGGSLDDCQCGCPGKPPCPEKPVVKDNFKNSKALYDPMYNKLASSYGYDPEDVDSYNKLINDDRIHSYVRNGLDNAFGYSPRDLGEDGKRRIPPVTKNISELQDIVLKTPPEELKELLSKDYRDANLLNMSQYLPDGVGLFKALKYANEFRKLRNKGYTFKEGGQLKETKKPQEKSFLDSIFL